MGIWSYFIVLRLLTASGGKSLQDYPVNVRGPPGSILGPTLFLLHLPDDVICNIAVNADAITSYSKFDQPCDLWQQLELASELASDLPEAVDWDRK